MVTLQTSTLPSTWRTTRFPVFVPPREIDEVVLDSIARADSYWRIAYRYLEMVTLVTSTLPSTWRREIDEVVLESVARADSYWRIWRIAYRYLEMVTLQTSTLPSTWRTTRFPVFCTATGK